MDSKCKNFALLSWHSLLDSNQNSVIFRGACSVEVFIIVFVYYGRFVCCKDHGLHLYMHGLRDWSVDLPMNKNARICIAVMESRYLISVSHETFPEEVEAVINRLLECKSVRMNDIPIRILKLCKSALSPFLAQIFNLCIRKGTYPKV